MLSVIKYSFAHWGSGSGSGSRRGSDAAAPADLFCHLSIDVDDVEDENLLQHFPRAVRFIENGLYPGSFPSEDKAPVRGNQKEEDKDSEHDDGVVFAEDDGPKSKADSDPDAITSAPQAPPQATTTDILSPWRPTLLPDPTSAPSNAQGSSAATSSTAGRPEPKPEGTSPGAVFVHCAMGKSRSVSAVIAYLLWKHPERYRKDIGAVVEDGKAGASASGSAAKVAPERGSGDRAVMKALSWVRNARPIAEPNPGFMEQLALWWEMGCPLEEGVLQRKKAYRKWLFDREVEESVRLGRAPDTLRFEDEEDDDQDETKEGGATTTPTPKKQDAGLQLRCKKCRRILVSQRFIIAHPVPSEFTSQNAKPCQHYFVEPLSWMRHALEGKDSGNGNSAGVPSQPGRNSAADLPDDEDGRGPLEGRLSCPGSRCGALVGRFSWKGFRCTCGDWVTPAFSLQKSRVDEHDPATSTVAIRMPPGMSNL